jgi:hypothetical protein
MNNPKNGSKSRKAAKHAKKNKDLEWKHDSPFL